MTYRYYLRPEGAEPIDITDLGTFSVGRCGDLKIGGEEASISRKHFIVALPKQGGAEAWIFDGYDGKPSKNGTIINGSRCLRGDADMELDKGCPIFHGDLIQAGKIKMYFLVFTQPSHCDPFQTMGDND